VAKIAFKMPEKFLLQVSQLGQQTDAICEKTLQAGAEVVESKMRSNLQSVIGSGVKVPSRSTGELLNSLGVSPVLLDDNGNANIKVGFNEPRREQHQAKGKRSYHESTNAMIANVLEYGKSGQPAKPFLKPTKSQARKPCREAMIKTIQEEIKKI